MSDSPLRLALVGCPSAPTLSAPTLSDQTWGNQGVWHDLAFRLKRCQFTVVANKDSSAASSTASAVGAEFIVEDFGVALDHHGADFDAVVFATSLASDDVATQDLAIRSAEAQKHLLLAAPVAASTVATRAIVDACDQAGTAFGVAETLRFAPDSQAIQSRVASGDLGAPGLLRVHRWRPAHAANVTKSIFRDIDLANWLYGTTPESVYAVGRGGTDPSRPEYLQLHLGFVDGGMAILDFSATLPDGESYDSWSLIGATGAAYADDHRNTHLLFSGGNPSALISRQGRGHLVAEYQAFVDRIAGTPTNSASTNLGMSGKECRAVCRVVDAVQNSLSSGQPVHCGSDHDSD